MFFAFIWDLWLRICKSFSITFPSCFPPLSYSLSLPLVIADTRERLTSDDSMELNCNGFTCKQDTLLHTRHPTDAEDADQSMYEYCNGAESPELDQAGYSNGTSGQEQLEEEELHPGEQEQQKSRTRAREQNKEKLKNGQWSRWLGFWMKITREISLENVELVSLFFLFALMVSWKIVHEIVF